MLWRKNTAALILLWGACFQFHSTSLYSKDPATSVTHELSCARKAYLDATKDETELEVVQGSGFLDTSKEVISMGGQLSVCVKGLYNWTYEKKNVPSNLRLAIGGHVLETIVPSTIGPAEQEYVNYIVKIDGSASPDWKEWAAIVEAARAPGQPKLPISLAVKDTKELVQSDFYAPLITYPQYSLYLTLLFVLLLGALLALAARSNLLRYTAGNLPTAPSRPPFSLGLTQMAFWFYLIVAAYVYICVTMKQVQIPIGSALGLLGISSTTGLAAVFVDIKKNDPAADERDKLKVEASSLNTRIGQLTPAPPASINVLSPADLTELAAKTSRLAEINTRLAQLPAPQPPSSKGIVADLLDDGDGISFHRFQIVIWTIVLGAVFVWGVYRNLTMPEFDASLLTLMGISAGTYVGFKFPEKPKT